VATFRSYFPENRNATPRNDVETAKQNETLQPDPCPIEFICTLFSQAFEDRYFKNVDFPSKSKSHPGPHNCSADASLRAIKQVRRDGVESVPTWPKNVAPFTIAGWPVDALSPGTRRLLRTIVDQDGSTIEEVMATAMKEFEIERKAEKELETKIIRFPKR